MAAVILKVEREGEIRRLRLAGAPNYAAVRVALETLWPGCDVALAKYQDEAGDANTLSEATFADFLGAAGNAADRRVLRLQLQGAPAPAPAPTALPRVPSPAAEAQAPGAADRPAGGATDNRASQADAAGVEAAGPSQTEADGESLAAADRPGSDADGLEAWCIVEADAAGPESAVSAYGPAKVAESQGESIADAAHVRASETVGRKEEASDAAELNDSARPDMPSVEGAGAAAAAGPAEELRVEEAKHISSLDLLGPSANGEDPMIVELAALPQAQVPADPAEEGRAGEAQDGAKPEVSAELSALASAAETEQPAAADGGGPASDEGNSIWSGDTIYLRAHTGRIVAVEGESAHAKWGNRGEWEKLAIERVGGNGAVQAGDTVLLRAHTGKRLTAQQDGEVHAKWDHQGEWQKLLIETDGGAAVGSGAAVYLLVQHTGKRLTVEGECVHARWGDKGGMQKFTIERVAEAAGVA